MWFMSHLDPLVHGNTMIHVGSPNLVHVIPVWELHDLVPGTSLDFFFDKKKEVYSRSYLIKKNIRQTKDDRKYKNKNKKQRKKLITKERSKERNERITRSESSSPRPIKKGTTERSKQLVFRTFNVLKSMPITLLPNTPH